MYHGIVLDLRTPQRGKPVRVRIKEKDRLCRYRASQEREAKNLEGRRGHLIRKYGYPRLTVAKATEVAAEIGRREAERVKARRERTKARVPVLLRSCQEAREERETRRAKKRKAEEDRRETRLEERRAKLSSFQDSGVADRLAALAERLEANRVRA